MDVPIALIARRNLRQNRRLAMAVAALAGTALAQSPAVAGAQFTAVTRNQTTGMRFPVVGNATVRGAVDGERGRLEYLEGGGLASLPKGTVLVTKDGAQTRKVYNPRDHSCGDWVLPSAPASASYEHLKVDKTLDEAGPKLHGAPTRHLRYAIAYDLTSGRGDSAKSLPGTITTELWIAPSLTDPAFALWLGAAPHTGNADADRAIAAAMPEKIQGAALKRIQRTTLDLGGGKQQTTTSTMEVTALSRQRPAPQALAPPFDCRIAKPTE